MKRIAIIAAVILLLASVVLAACGKTGESSAPAHDISLTSEYGASSAEGSSAPEADESSESSAEESSEQPEQSEPIAEVSGSESSADPEYEGEEINVLYASYSEKPYYAIVGTCAQGATITARSASGTEYTSESFYGWFSVRVKCESTPDSVSLTQSAGGKQLGNTRVFSIKPVTPSSEMWPIITGKNMQFFLQKMLPDFSGKRVLDVTSGFRATNARMTAYFARHYAIDYPEPEAALAAILAGFKVAEAPVIMRERQGGVSSIHSFKSAYYMIKVSLALIIDRLSIRKSKGGRA